MVGTLEQAKLVHCPLTLRWVVWQLGSSPAQTVTQCCSRWRIGLTFRWVSGLCLLPLAWRRISLHQKVPTCACVCVCVCEGCTLLGRRGGHERLCLIHMYTTKYLLATMFTPTNIYPPSLSLFLSPFLSTLLPHHFVLLPGSSCCILGLLKAEGLVSCTPHRQVVQHLPQEETQTVISIATHRLQTRLS